MPFVMDNNFLQNNITLNLIDISQYKMFQNYIQCRQTFIIFLMSGSNSSQELVSPRRQEKPFCINSSKEGQQYFPHNFNNSHLNRNHQGQYSRKRQCYPHKDIIQSYIQNCVYKITLPTPQSVFKLSQLVVGYRKTLRIVHFSKKQLETTLILWLSIAYKEGLSLYEYKRQSKQFEVKIAKYFLFIVESRAYFNHTMDIALNQLLQKIIRESISHFLIKNRLSQHVQGSHHLSLSSRSRLPFDEFNIDLVENNNCQGREYIIEKTEQQDPLSFKRLNQILKKQNSLALKPAWDNGLKNQLEDIQKNWNVYRQPLRQELSTFTMLNMYKMYKMNSAQKFNKRSKDKRHAEINFYEYVYPKMAHFINFFSKKLGILSIHDYLQQKYKSQGKKRQLLNKSHINNNSFELDQQLLMKTELQHMQALRMELKIEQNIADKIFYYFLGEQHLKQLNQFNQGILVNQSMELKQYISTCQDFYINSSHWTSIFSTYFHLYNQSQKNNSNFFNNIQNERLVQNQCLGCSKFFILDQNIYDENANKSPIKIFPSILKLRQIEVAVKDQICGILNSGGGIILFNCHQKYRGIYPQGIPMTQKDKQQYQQRIYSYACQFYPKIQVKTHIQITFVPVIKLEDLQHQKHQIMKKYTGQEAILKEAYLHLDRSYCRGLFVARIKVVPADPSLVYFWYIIPKSLNDNEMRNFCQVNKSDGSAIKLKVKQMIKLIKQRMKQFYVKQTLSDEERHLLMHPSLYIHHECHEPDQGIAISQIYKYPSLQKPSDGNGMQDQYNYNYLSLLVVKRKFHDKIRQNFRKSRLNVKLKVLFEDKKFKNVHNTAALFHNNKFEQIFKQVSNNRRYLFQDRSVYVINVTSFLKLDRRNQQYPLQKDEFNKISNSFAQMYPNETIKAFEFKTIQGKSQYFLLTQTKSSNLYLYYLINQIPEKAVFKNPYLLDKLSQAQRQQRMILKFQKKGRNELISNLGQKFSQSYFVDMPNQCRKYRKISLPINEACKIKSLDQQISQNEQKPTKQQQSEVNSTRFEKRMSIELQQEQYFYESWQEVLEMYDYSIDSVHKSLNPKDLQILDPFTIYK